MHFLEEAFKGKASRPIGTGLSDCNRGKRQICRRLKISLAYFESKVLEYKKIGIAHVTSASCIDRSAERRSTECVYSKRLLMKAYRLNIRLMHR